MKIGISDNGGVRRMDTLGFCGEKESQKDHVHISDLNA